MNSLFPLPSLHPTPSLGVAPPPPSPRSTSPVWSLLPSKFSFSPHPENILVLTAPVLLGCMSFSWQFSPIPSLFSSLLPPGWLPDSCLWALLYPFLEADPVSTSNSPSWRTCLSPNLLCLPTYLAPIQFLSPPRVIQGASCSMFPRGELEGQVPRSPFLPSDLAWSRAARNWNCRSSSNSHSLVRWCAGRGWNRWRTALWSAGEPPPSANGVFSRVFHGGFWGNTSDKVTILLFRLEDPWQKKWKKKCL